jgi:DNA repair exonuclease SbcCD ATPase subunit
VPNLELNWDNLESAMTQVTSVAHSPAANNDEAQSELRSQIESEQKARLVAEEARAEAETKAADLEKKLRKAEEKYKTAEAGYKKVLRKQEEELRTLSEQITRGNDSTTSLAMAKTDDEIMFLDATQSGSGNGRIKLVFYGALITALMSALVWLGVVAFHQL